MARRARSRHRGMALCCQSPVAARRRRRVLRCRRRFLCTCVPNSALVPWCRRRPRRLASRRDAAQAASSESSASRVEHGRCRLDSRSRRGHRTDSPRRCAAVLRPSHIGQPPGAELRRYARAPHRRSGWVVPTLVGAAASAPVDNESVIGRVPGCCALGPRLPDEALLPSACAEGASDSLRSLAATIMERCGRAPRR